VRNLPSIASVAIRARARVSTEAAARRAWRASARGGGVLGTGPTTRVCRRCSSPISDGTRKQWWAQSGWLPDIETRGSERLSLPDLEDPGTGSASRVKGHHPHYQGIALMNG
jgi:hypothetical protein